GGIGSARARYGHGRERRRRGGGLGVRRLRRGCGRDGGPGRPRRGRQGPAVHVRLLRRRGLRRRPHVRRHDPPAGGAARLVSLYETLRDALRAEEPVALATIVEVAEEGTDGGAGPELGLGAKLLVRPDSPVLGSLGDEALVDWPDRYLAKVGQNLGPRDAVCVLTHDPKFDVPALMAALSTDAGYVGAMGSRRTHGERVERLREAGATDDDLARVMSPIG